ncbi:MAG: sterol carrier family protein [Dermatophilaceae bacterium]
MPPRRRTGLTAGRAALDAWRADPASADRATTATAVRHTLDELSARVPGRSVEVRVPPFGVVQCIAGPTHTRGTPPNTVETDPQTWLALATGATTWADAIAGGRLRTSGVRADLSAVVPLTGPDSAAG